jgi:hypothetical protein
MVAPDPPGGMCALAPTPPGTNSPCREACAMTTKTPNIRHRRADRRHVRHSKQELAWIAEQNTRLASGAVAATSTLTLGANPGDGKIVTIGSKVYTFQTVLTEADGHVLIGADATASAVNLFHAINRSGGTAGTDYATATTANTDVVATNPSITVVKVTAKVKGTASNSIATTTDVVSGVWNHATLTGGVGAIQSAAAVAAAATLTLGANPADTKIVTIGSKVYTFQSVLTNVDGNVKIGADATASAVNLLHAINASGGTAGTDYALATTAHADVTADTPSAGVVKVTAKVAGTAANSKVTTTDVASATWDVAHLTGGAAAVTGTIDVATLLLTNKAETIAAATNTSTLS